VTLAAPRSAPYVHGVMRALAAMLAVALTFEAAAQEPPSPLPAPPPPPPSVTIPAPPLQVQPLPTRITPESDVIARWRRARIVSVIGTLLSLVGTGLSLASVIYVAATHYPPSGHDLLNQAAPSDPGPVLAYAGSTTSAAGFIFTAAALGYEHRILDRVGVDPGRGLFATGTVIGMLGFTAVGASYFFGLTNYLDAHDQQVAVLATSIGGAALCGLAGLVYLFDSSRDKKVWKHLSSF
jgi:hypothetical protein